MPAKKEYTPEFKEQAVRFVLGSIEPNESRRRACERVAPKLSMNPITLYAWVKASAPGPSRPASSPGSVEELRAQSRRLRRLPPSPFFGWPSGPLRDVTSERSRIWL